ncbi:rhomboid family intramembrane serine protease [Desulfobulbus sp.]|uniref:rhomboid family intramembrane serine protease n=1 Tax=Desulfobulbus sp. TaxID=895 RepID=UPI0027BA25E4|nr:rhomboid family intramembrane serine protease [Desulfobulbus sp.]
MCNQCNIDQPIVKLFRPEALGSAPLSMMPPSSLHTENQLRPEPLTQVASGELDRLESLSLVLSAVGVAHWLDEQNGELLVAEHDAATAAFHLRQYSLENADWPPAPPPPRPIHPQTPPTIVLMALLALFFVHTGPWSTGNNWFAQGAVDGPAILQQGEWWRLATALTLHADLVHLAGNGLIGGLMIHLLGKTVGYGLAWLLLIVSGMAGNLLNVVVRHQPHLSVGLSTAVFAAIGLLVGLQLGHSRTRSQTRSLRELLLPLGAGAGLLAALGSEGVRTDLGAHFFGGIVGLCCGVLLEMTGAVARCRRPFIQALLFSLAVTILMWCWRLALR